MKGYTINFFGQVYFPKVNKSHTIINNASELEASLKEHGFYPVRVKMDRMAFSEELNGRLLYRVKFDVEECDNKKPTVASIDQYFNSLNCRYKGKIVKYKF